jgi:hypothetical protein
MGYGFQGQGHRKIVSLHSLSPRQTQPVETNGGGSECDDT